MPEVTGLVDVQQMAKDFPDTFDAPSAKELAALKFGDFVKLCRNAERFWVHVVRVESLTRITGTLANDLVIHANRTLRIGDPIYFEARHIYTITPRQT